MLKPMLAFVMLVFAFAAAAAEPVPGQANPDRFGVFAEREVVLLQSQKGHEGTCRWQMVPADKVPEQGDVVSRVGFESKLLLDAIVPGTVLNSLVANQKFPEPYFGLNNAHEGKRIPDISEVGPKYYTYWMRTEFTLPESFRGRRVWLQFDGINYRAELWLNGKRLGFMAGMFQRGWFDVTDGVQFGKPNALAVKVQPPDWPGGFKNKFDKPRAAGENRNGGDGQIGYNVTMLMTAGWDFSFPDGIRDRNTGIWRDVKLYATGPVALRSPFVRSELPLPATSPAREHISVEVINNTGEAQTGTLRATIPQLAVTVEKTVSLYPHEQRLVTLGPEEFAGLVVKNPRLWWPFNKGEPFLHELQLEFRQADRVSDRLATRFGIRDIRSDQNTPDQSRQFFVNGKRLFLHGSNWLPEAMCRTSPARTYAELRYTRQAGVNFLRLWAGGIAESDQFFDLCDELGILVWMEFWQAGDTFLPLDAQLYRANFADTVKRLRNHASLAFYVSGNEVPGGGAAMRPNQIVPAKDLVDELDPTHGWIQSSENDGVHDGSPYVALNPMWYYEDTASSRGSRINGLCPEYGCPCLPTIDCLREMMDEKDLWPINKVTWDYLDGGGFQQMTTEYDKAVRQYGPSNGIEEYAWKGQMFGALAYRAIWEVWNANRFDYGDRFCTGLLFWYHNSPNRQVCSRMWDWSLEPTAALYFSQTAHQPLHAQFDFLKNTVAVNNELPQAFAGCQLTVRIFNFDMTEAYRQTVKLDVPADRLVKEVLKVELPANLTPVHFIRLDLADAAGKPLSDNFYWRSNKAYKPGRTATGPQYEGFEDIGKLPRVTLDAQFRKTQQDGWTRYTGTVRNPSKSLAFFVWLRLQDAATGKPVRPAYFNDNFISLLPGESKTITIEHDERVTGSQPTRLIVDGWNVEKQTIKF